MSVYYKYSAYLRKKHGEKTYKLPVNLPLTCPNRDGFLGRTGCSFCGEDAGAHESLTGNLSVSKQLLKNREYIGSRYGAKKFIAYFQNYSNTYLPLAKLKEYLQDVFAIEGIVEIVLSTRPDCINKRYIEGIKEVINRNNPAVGLSFELGLQTVNYHTLKVINRGHTLAEFIEAVILARDFNIPVGTHLILNLPGDNDCDVIENAKIVSALGVANVKLHALYIREGTTLAREYQEGNLELITLDEYIARVIEFLQYLSPDIAVQRLLGRAPEEGTLFVNWDYSWWKIHDMIIKEMKQKGLKQGDKFDYLGGKALRGMRDCRE
ncbi:TIGR01212 family radical SAM protein [Iocasia frigidifontis]|uniref:TIGR01212 family radical SAM protein n=1 Tax=Iocasia fonsfrigidae TaxID=2682810 RepID=A0A8A7KAB9_9FIRM|nr:TIGR01212 family radical SAM protein [Iocasia fonsfrigidae]QTL98706.1 TIGR01212 family radical SAM protein [Iocasia fonsfrigidae]